MVKQVKIFYEYRDKESLERDINRFCMDFFPEEIFEIKILPIVREGQYTAYTAYITYQKDEYEES